MRFLPGTPGPISYYLSHCVLWIGRKLGYFPKEPQTSPREQERIMMKLVCKGFHFKNEDCPWWINQDICKLDGSRCIGYENCVSGRMIIRGMERL